MKQLYRQIRQIIAERNFNQLSNSKSSRSLFFNKEYEPTEALAEEIFRFAKKNLAP
jgi:hypothetical protein